MNSFANIALVVFCSFALIGCSDRFSYKRTIIEMPRAKNSPENVQIVDNDSPNTPIVRPIEDLPNSVPDTSNPGGQVPGTENPGVPGNNPGNGSPVIGNPGNGNPDNHNPNDGNDGSPGSDIPNDDFPNNDNPSDSPPGSSNPGDGTSAGNPPGSSNPGDGPSAGNPPGSSNPGDGPSAGNPPGSSNPGDGPSAGNPPGSSNPGDGPSAGNPPGSSNPGDGPSAGNPPGSPVVVHPQDPDSPEDLPVQYFVPAEQKAQACTIKIKTGLIGNNVRLTVFSGPADKISQFEHPEFLRLPLKDQEFLKDSLSEVSNGVSKKRPGKKKGHVNRKSEMKVSFKKSIPGTSFNYILKGKKTDFLGSSLKKGSRLIAVMSGEKESRLNIHSLESDTEVFLLIPTDSQNVTCISTSEIGDDVVINSHVFGASNSITQGLMQISDIQNRGQIKHHVNGSDNSLSFLKLTELSNAQLDIQTNGKKHTQSILDIGRIHTSNKINFKLTGTEDSYVKVRGIDAGQDTVINLDVEGQKNIGALFNLSSENNVSISGKIKAKSNPYLLKQGSLNGSQTAKVSVELIKN